MSFLGGTNMQNERNEGKMLGNKIIQKEHLLPEISKILDNKEKIIQKEMDEIKKIPYKETDLLYAIEKGNKERVLAHIRSQTPLNNKTHVHRDLLHSFTAFEYSAHLKNYAMVKLIRHYGGEVTDYVRELAKSDPALHTLITKK